MSGIAKALDRWFGRGEASITTPPMDGAFRPNDLLDAAPVVLEALVCPVMIVKAPPPILLYH